MASQESSGEAERDQTRRWRTLRLMELGVPLEKAVALSEHVDYHELEKLLANGCPLKVALRIVE